MCSSALEILSAFRSRLLRYAHGGGAWYLLVGTPFDWTDWFAHHDPMKTGLHETRLGLARKRDRRYDEWYPRVVPAASVKAVGIVDMGVSICLHIGIGGNGDVFG